MYFDLKQRVFEANLMLPKLGLVDLTWGNVSEVDRANGVVAIKPSGVAYDAMSAEDIVIVDLKSGEVVDGKLNPSSDLPTHLELYRAFENIVAVVHTHSKYATSFAQSKQEIIPLGTTHADTFYGAIPYTRGLTDEEIKGDYEVNTGKVIAERFENLDYDAIPSVLVACHGVFTWGKSAVNAVENALITERVAEMAYITKTLGNQNPISQTLLDKHYERKHGKNAYYGQKNK